MALNTKINLPISTTSALPNVNNKTAEATYVGQLANKTNRSNSGQIVYNSTTSGISYKTVDYPNETNIYNKGETGMYNLLIKLYGGDGGFMVMAEDYNALTSAINTNESNITTINGQIEDINSQVSTLSTNVSTNENDIATLQQNQTTIDRLISANATKITAINNGSLDTRYYTKTESDSKYFLQDNILTITGTIPVVGTSPYRYLSTTLTFGSDIAWSYSSDISVLSCQIGFDSTTNVMYETSLQSSFAIYTSITNAIGTPTLNITVSPYPVLTGELTTARSFILKLIRVG